MSDILKKVAYYSFPIGYDLLLPELIVKLFRFSENAFQIRISIKGDCPYDEIYCKLGIICPDDSGKKHVLKYNEWIKNDKREIVYQININNLPNRLMTSRSPKIGHNECVGINWIAILSKRRKQVKFFGKIIQSDPPPPFLIKLKFIG